MDFERFDIESSFGGWYVWLMLAGAPHASELMTAALGEQNRQRS
jgi:hypothetical protein